jgi:phosphatidylinositol glycan class M
MYLGVENKNRWMGLVAFIPQMALVVMTGIVFGKDIFFACFIQTFVFVTFNKVCTSQVRKEGRNQWKKIKRAHLSMIE